MSHHHYHDTYERRADRFGNSPRSVGYLVPRWARFERACVQRLVAPDAARILDVGSGICFMTEGLSADHQVVSLDASIEHLLLCPSFPCSGSVVGDAFRLPFLDHAFDVVLCLNVIQWYPLPKGGEMLAELARVVRPGGRVILLVRNRRSLVRLLTHPAYRAALRLTGGTAPRYFGYDDETIAAVMRAAGLSARPARYLFPPFHLNMGRSGRFLGTTGLMVCEREQGWPSTMPDDYPASGLCRAKPLSPQKPMSLRKGVGGGLFD